jgi:hypothetical protein
VVRRRPTRTTVERVSAAGRRENAVARRTHRRTDEVDDGVGALGHARSGVDSSGRRRARRGGRRQCCRSVGRAVGRRLTGVPLMSAIFELNLLPEENSSNQIARD